MKSINIIKKLEKEGYKITYKKWHYWDNVPHVELNGFNFTLAEMKGETWLGINLDFIYNHVQEALHVAKNNNPTILKKIEKSPAESWYYSRYLILSMEDYYQYKKGVYPFDAYHQILQKLKKEI